jgi:hypothetical protein
MAGEKDLKKLLATMEPVMHSGEFVFCSVRTMDGIAVGDVVMCFREGEGIALILEKERADRQGLKYDFVAAWITLTVHSSLEAVGLTAAFSTALTNAGISCNVVAGFYHDHIFVNIADAGRAMDSLRELRTGGL